MTNTSMTSRWRAVCVLPLALAWTFAAVPSRAQDAPTPYANQNQNLNAASLSQAQILQLVAPIALYPDPLLTQVLMASTYPLEVVEAARWSHDNSGVSGQGLERAMQGQSWDPSIKALTAVPQTLAMMSDKIDWTEQLGDAFLAQQQDVLDAVQKLRAEAQAAGNLQSTPQQVVTTAPAPTGTAVSNVQRPIVIEPVNPNVYYVPVYNPAVVYGGWEYPAYPPFYWSPPGFVASNAVSFAAGVAVGAAIWGGCDWWNHNVFINVNRYNVFNRTYITNNIWIHNPVHRGNVPYHNAALAARFGRANEMDARETLRDRVDGVHDVFRNDDGGRVDARRTEGGAETTGLSRDRVDAPHTDPLRQTDVDVNRAAESNGSDRLNHLDADLQRDGGDRGMDHMELPRGRPFGDGGEGMRGPRMPSTRAEGDGLGHMDFRRR
jgi:Protein of unknown function (DUF3300)